MKEIRKGGPLQTGGAGREGLWEAAIQPER